jgi:hypothetical protein
MGDPLQRVLQELQEENLYSVNKWGVEFDNRNTANDWNTYIGIYNAQACRTDATPGDFRKNMLKVANLALSAILAYDRNNGLPPRHYASECPSNF